MWSAIREAIGSGLPRTCTSNGSDSTAHLRTRQLGHDLDSSLPPPPPGRWPVAQIRLRRRVPQATRGCGGYHPNAVTSMNQRTRQPMTSAFVGTPRSPKSPLMRTPRRCSARQTKGSAPDSGAVVPPLLLTDAAAKFSRNLDWDERVPLDARRPPRRVSRRTDRNHRSRRSPDICGLFVATPRRWSAGGSNDHRAGRRGGLASNSVG